ncbi:hypothetical protein G6F65_022030 [Rhizopus arrhizus]|nr:hypothetical protein G6F65_022030 [Rhizopus arrhizus]
MRARFVADQFDGVHVAGAQHDRTAGADVHAPHMGQGIAQRILAGGARIDLVALVAVHPGDDGPRRMVMRRLCLARFAQRQVQRIAAVDVLGQTIDRGRAARHDGKGLGGKQVAALPQRLQQLAGPGR